MPWNSSVEAQRQYEEALNECRRKALLRQSVSAPAPKKKLSRGQRRRLSRQGKLSNTNSRRFISYHDYIKSKAWKKRRAAYFLVHGHTCAICGAPAYELHHKNYKRLGREKDSDLQPLCGGCHSNTHEGEKKACYDPITKEFMSLVRGF